MADKFYLTTPLYYVNGAPHVGHAYTTVIADAITRYKRLCGLKVFSLTGTDEHGLKIERAAQDQGMTPKKLTDTYAAAFAEAWSQLGLYFDESIRTTEERHHRTVVEVFKSIKGNNFIYLGEYEGNYCVNCEAYAPEGQETCLDCGRTAEHMTEQSYFFKLSAFQKKLLKFYKENPNFVVPATRMNEIISFVRGGLKDLSISRTSFRWGIHVPESKGHIFYVWFDALAGYLSGIGFGTRPEDFQLLWPADVQLIGKDILRFHAVYWPAFLMAAGLELPRCVLVNGWWTVEGEKMSKSRGNTITTRELAEVVEPDWIKYFLLREIAIGADGNFSYDLLLSRVNSDLANDLGNLCSRVLTMIDRYFGGRIPECGETKNGDNELQEFTTETVVLYRESFDCFKINKAIDKVWELISTVNKYLVFNEPWHMARDSSKKERLGTVLYHAAESLRIIAILLSPIIPDGASEILKQLGVSKPLGDQRVQELSWGSLKKDSTIGSIRAIYPRLDPKEFMDLVHSERQNGKPSQEEVGGIEVSKKEQIRIKDFARIDMRVGKILIAERVKKSKKLLKLSVDIGSEVRQVVAGIGEEYSPDVLPGRLVAMVTNLKPVRLMGIESNGMIVAASDQGRPVLVTFTEAVTIGTRLR